MGAAMLRTSDRRRIEALEAALCPLPPAAHELWRDLPRALSFEQAALEAYAGDPLASVRAGDPVVCALVAVARARRALEVATPPTPARS